jgi:hypothetical protein
MTNCFDIEAVLAAIQVFDIHIIKVPHKYFSENSYVLQKDGVERIISEEARE